MRDLISRQAAIEAINAVFPVDSMKSEYAQGITCGAALAKTYVEQLPSAQPQLDTCPIYGGMCGYPSNLCYECPRHEGAKERPQWWTEGLQPFAQPQRIKGRWIYGEHDIAMCDGYRCDKCGFFVPWDYEFKFIDFINDYHFCPNCGSDMRGEQDG